MTEQFEDPHARDERYVWFALEGDFEPDEITRATGLTPSETRRKGTRARPRAAVRTDSGWLLDSGLGPSDEFHEHLEALLVRLRPGWDALRALGKKHQAYVTAAIYCLSAQGPLVEVSPRHGSAIAELGATLGFDIYAVPEDEPDESADERPLTRGELMGLNRMRLSEA